MTLSGKSDKQQRLEDARRARQERAAAQQERKPWLMPLIITIAVLAIAYALFLTLTGQVRGL